MVVLCLAYQASINPYQYYHFFICLWTCYNCELWPIYCFRQCQNTTVAKFASYSSLSTWDRTFAVALIASRANYRTSMFKFPQRAKAFAPPCLLRTWCTVDISFIIAHSNAFCSNRNRSWISLSWYSPAVCGRVMLGHADPHTHTC